MEWYSPAAADLWRGTAARNPIGWLFVAAGLAHSTTALATPLGALLHATAAPIALQRIVITIFAWSWPWSIGLVLPLLCCRSRRTPAGAAGGGGSSPL